MRLIELLKLHGQEIPRCRVLFVATALLLGAVGCQKAGPPPPPAPPEVQVMTVTLQDVPIYQEWIGNDRRIKTLLDQIRKVDTKAAELLLKDAVSG